MCDIGGDGVDWYDGIIYKAATKPHLCHGCRRESIRKGDAFVLYRWRDDDGKMNASVGCADCWAAINAFGEVHEVYPFPETLAVCLKECFAETPREFWTENDRLWFDLHQAIVARRAAA